MRIVKLTEIGLELQENTDLQMIASELDATLKTLFCLEDDNENPKFTEFLEDLKRNELGMYYDENTVLYNYNEERIVFHETIYERYLIFDHTLKNKIKAILQL